MDNGADGHDPVALSRALHFEKTELIPILLAARGKVNCPEDESCGYSALQAAIETQQSAVVQILLKARIDVNHPPSLCAKIGCRTSLGALYTAIQTRNIQILRTLLKARADPNIIGGELGTPLQLATRIQDVLLMQIFLEAGATLKPFCRMLVMVSFCYAPAKALPRVQTNSYSISSAKRKI